MHSRTSAFTATRQADWKAICAEWWPVLAGLLAMYVPSFIDLAYDSWSTPDQAHGPIVLVMVGYLFWRGRETFLQPPAGRCQPLLGGVALVLGLAFYAVGRSQDIQVFEIGSLIPVLLGCVLMTRGWRGVRELWFALAFIIFLVPVPGAIVDAATGSLKAQISVIAENVLYHLGYPIARTGVTIVIGSYQLLVADACSGLHSMFSLSALGMLYLYLMQYRSWLRNGLILLCVLPIAFVANVVRVMLLVLVTYHFGDAAGQGFLHDFAGMVMFIAALLSLFLLDYVLGLIFKVSGSGTAARPDAGAKQ